MWVGYTGKFSISGWLLYFSRYWNFIHNLCFIVPNSLLHAPNHVICQWISCPLSLPHLMFPFHHCLSHMVSVQCNKTRHRYYTLVIMFVTLLMVKPSALNVMSLCVHACMFCSKCQLSCNYICSYAAPI